MTQIVKRSQMSNWRGKWSLIEEFDMEFKMKSIYGVLTCSSLSSFSTCMTPQIYQMPKCPNLKLKAWNSHEFFQWNVIPQGLSKYSIKRLYYSAIVGSMWLHDKSMIQILLAMPIGKRLRIYARFGFGDKILVHSLANVDMTSVHIMKIFTWI